MSDKAMDVTAELMRELIKASLEISDKDFLKHSLEVMTIVIPHTKNNSVVWAALLHETKEKLNSKSWNKFKDIITDYSCDKKSALRLAYDTELLVDSLTCPKGVDRFDFTRQMLFQSNGYQELIVLANLLSELRSLILKENELDNYHYMLEELILQKTVDKNDPLIKEIRNHIKTQHILRIN